MRPGGKSNGESPFFETPNLSFEERVGNVAIGTMTSGAARRTCGWSSGAAACFPMAHNVVASGMTV